MKIYLKEEKVLKMTLIRLDATCSPTKQATNHLGAIQRDFLLQWSVNGAESSAL